MKRWIALALAALASTTGAARADQCSMRNGGGLLVLPGVGGVMANGGAAKAEERLGAGVQLAGAFGWQMCEPKLFLGLGASYTFFAYYSETGRRLNTSTPGIFDAYATARMVPVAGLYLQALGGVTSTGIIKARPELQPGAIYDRSQALRSLDVASDGGGVFGIGVGYLLLGNDPGKANISIGFEPRLRVVSSGTLWTFPIVIDVPIPLN